MIAKKLYGGVLHTVLAVLLCTGCTQKEESVLEPIPPLQWQEMQVTPFLAESAWRNTQPNWMPSL